MAAGVIVAATWDFATYGTCMLLLTDDVVTGVPVTFSVGTYDAADLCLGAGVTSPAVAAWTAALAAALSAASPTRSYTVDFSVITGRYTITTDEGVTFALAFTSSGAAGLRFQKLLGFTGDPHSFTTYTSDLVPWFVIVPAKPGLTKYVPPVQQSGVVKQRISSTGAPSRLQPTSIPRLSRWEHHFEPKYMVDRDARGATGDTITQLYSWEQLWNDYRLAQLPIGIRIERADGNYEKMAFSLENAEYDESAYQRMRDIDDFRFKVMVKARLWLAPNTTSGFARAFNV